jgi:hypothetical protein
MERLKKESACEYLKAGAERVLAKKSVSFKAQPQISIGQDR